ncbi:hypothetical protein [Streptomyces sp. NPDC046332]
MGSDLLTKSSETATLGGDSVHHAILGIARMHSLALAGWISAPYDGT